MELQDYLTILRKRWLSILLITVLAAGGAVGLTLTMKPQYQATTQLYVSVQGQASTSDLLQGANYSRQQVTSYLQFVTSPKVLGPVIDSMGLAERADTLAADVSATSPLNSSLVNITVTDPSPALAAAKANAIGSQFRDFVSTLETPPSGRDSTVKVSVVRDAAAPEAPSSPKLKLNVALGLLVGLALGVGVAVVREVLDTRVRTAQDIARVTDTSIVGTIVFDEDTPNHPLILQSDPHSQRAEAMRRLRTNVQFLNVNDRPQSIVVTSALPGEGKSTTVANLAIALADTGARVALVDADLRRPAVARNMGIEGAVGLTTILIGRAQLTDVIQPWGNGYLHVLPAGQIPPNPSELLGSLAMQRLLDQLTSTYDIVLVDTPPLLPVTDAAILTKMTAGALVVVSADKLHRNQLSEALESLERVDAPVLGIVLNRQRRKPSEGYEYYEYRSANGATTRRRRATPRAESAPPERSAAAAATAARRAATGQTEASGTQKLPTRVPTGVIPRQDVGTGTGGISTFWPGETFSESIARDGRPGTPQHNRPRE